MLKKLINKFKRRWVRLWYQPIRVFVFHHVSDERDMLVCQEPDWTQLDQFKRNIEYLMQDHTFISLAEACDKLHHEWFRCRKYAVLTADDGLASVQTVLPWLEEKKIPLTLFINTRYMEGNKIKPIHQKWLQELAPDADVKAIAKRMYLSKEQIFDLSSPNIEIGMHGHEHLDASAISEGEFEQNIEQCEKQLRTHPRYVATYAYPWGKCSDASLQYLQEHGIVPVVVDGNKNYVWNGYVSRESIDNVKMDA